MWGTQKVHGKMELKESVFFAFTLDMCMILVDEK